MRTKLLEMSLILSVLALYVKVLLREEGSFWEKFVYLISPVIGESVTAFAYEGGHSIVTAKGAASQTAKVVMI